MLTLTIHDDDGGQIAVLYNTDTGDKQLTATFAYGPDIHAQHWENYVWVGPADQPERYSELLQSMGRELYSVPVQQPTTEIEG